MNYTNVKQNCKSCNRYIFCNENPEVCNEWKSNVFVEVKKTKAVKLRYLGG